MSEGAIFLNSGPLFNAERLDTLEGTPEWTELEETVQVAYQMIREAFEKHATLLAGRPSVDETRYFMVTPTLHALGYMASVDERVEVSGAGSQARIDYALFPDPEDFTESEPSRGSAGFFRPAVGLVECVKWGQDLDAPLEDDDENGIAPDEKLDLLLRTTGCEYGILTNG